MYIQLKTRKLILLIAAILCCITSKSQISITEQLNNFVTKQDYDGGLSYLLQNADQLDPIAKDLYYTSFSIAKFYKKKSIDMDSCFHSMERVITCFAQNKENVKSLGPGMASYYSLFSGFLTWTNNWNLSLKVFKSFKTIWPKISGDIKDYYVAQLENTSNSLFTNKQYSYAIPVLNEIDSLQHKGYQFTYPTYFYEGLLGLCYHNTGQDDKALEILAWATASYPSDRKTEESYINLQRNRFDIAINKSILSTAREVGLELVNMYKTKGDKQSQIDIDLALSRLEASLNANTGEAIKLYENGIELILKSPDYTDDLREKYLKDLFTFYNTFNIPINQRKFNKYAKTLDMGEKYKINGFVDDTFIDSLVNVIRQEEGKQKVDVNRYVYAVSFVASNLANRLQERKGLDMVIRAIEKCQSQGAMPSEYASLYNVAGNIFSGNLADYDQALKNYAKALDILQDNGQQSSSLYLLTLSKIAIDYKNIGNLINAKIFIDKALDALLKSPELKSLKKDYYELLENASWIYACLGKEDESLKFCDEILDDVANNFPKDELVNLYKCLKIDLLLCFNRYNEANNIYKEINPTYFDKRKSWSLPFQTKFFNGDSSCVVELAKEHDRLCSNIKRLFEKFSTSDLFNYWDTNAGILNFYYSEALYKFRTPELRIQAFNNIQLTKNFQYFLSKNFRSNSSHNLQQNIAKLAVENAFSEIIDYDRIKEKLKESEIAIEFLVVNNRIDFHHVNNRYGALIVRKQDKYPIFVDICDYDALSWISFSSPSKAPIAYANNLYSIRDTRLFDILWKPLVPFISPHSILYVSKAGDLNNINLAAISDGTQRMGDLYDIHNVMSASSIPTGPDSKETFSSAYLCGGIDYDTSLADMTIKAHQETNSTFSGNVAYRGLDDRGHLGALQTSLFEIMAIKETIKNSIAKIKIVSGKEATEESFKRLNGQSPDIVHISTHGFYYQPYLNNIIALGNPQSSDVYFSKRNGRLNSGSQLQYNGLFFSGANNAWNFNKYTEGVDDGVLTGDEIAALDFSNTKLVVLSACQTGLGEISEIDGNMGLIKAFKIAGVKHIISTLWNVSDQATTIFMQEFYKQLVIQKNVHKAFNKAVNTFRSTNETYANPYYWAGFVMLD